MFAWLPLLIFLPVALQVIILAVRASLAPLNRFLDGLVARSARDLTLIPTDRLATGISPLADTLNRLSGRLAVAFEAERNFTANAAHELCTPLAGAIAQAQRLQMETGDAAARTRATDTPEKSMRLGVQQPGGRFSVIIADLCASFVHPPQSTVFFTGVYKK